LTELLVGNSDRQDSRVGNLLSVYSPEVVKEMVYEDGFKRYEEGQRRLDAYRSGEAWGTPKAGPARPGQAAESVPEGMDPEDWKYLTPEQKALWQK
jgi:hypothetical protein